jgi:hypothetical protein
MFQSVKVESSAISEVSYDKETQILRIQFVRGAEYDYPNVPEQEFKNLVSAPSVGKYYNANIKKYAVAQN